MPSATCTEPTPAWGARAVELFLIVLALAQLALLGQPSAVNAVSLFHLALFVHVWISIYDGVFTSARKLTWLLLCLAWIGGQVASFLPWVLPFGQAGFWLAHLASDWGLAPAVEAVGVALAPGGWLAWMAEIDGTVLLFIPLCLDMAALHADSWRRIWGMPPDRRRILLARGCALIVAALVLALAAPLLASPDGLAPTPATTDMALTPIIPDWYTLPVYAVLRAMPGKLDGVLTALVFLMLPFAAPWLGGARWRNGMARRWFQLACAGLALAWIFLVYLGAQPPDDAILWQSRAAMAYVLLFFVLIRPLLARLVPPATPGLA